MKILVTGGCGFIGSHLAERLSDEGHDILVIDSFAPNYSLNLKEFNAKLLTEKGIKIHRIDLCNDDYSTLLRDVEIIFHLAGQPGISESTTFDQYLKNNFIATYKLLKKIQNINLKLFVNVSTSSVYGSNATGPETSEPKPTSFYGVTKLAAEQLVMSYNRDKNMNACSLRIFSVYGERERPEKLYMKLIKSIVNDELFPLFEDSKEHIRSYTYVGDIIDGMILVLNNVDKCNGEIINLGNDKAITTKRGIELIEQILGKKAKFNILPKRVGDQLRTEANIKKAKELLNYTPKIQPEIGLRKEVEWCKKYSKVIVDN